MAKRKTGALGRGIAALFEENTIAPQDEGEQVQDIKLTAIRENPIVSSNTVISLWVQAFRTGFAKIFEIIFARYSHLL